MRTALLLFAACAACATTVRDLPVDGRAGEARAVLAGRLAFEGTRIDGTLRLRSLEGREVVVRPRHATFLVAVPPGTYEVRRFGAYAPSADTITLEAAPGPARYIGTFSAARDRSGNLRVLVRDDLDAVSRELAQRYGEGMPKLEAGLVRSRLPPVEQGGDLVIAVEKPTYASHGYFAFGFGYGYYSHPYWHYRHHHRHHRHAHRHPRRSRRR